MENTAANSTAWCSSVVLPSSVVLVGWWLHKLASVQPGSVVLPSGATNCRIYAVLSARCTQLQPSGGTGCVRMRTCGVTIVTMVDEVVLSISVLSVAIERRPRLSRHGAIGCHRLISSHTARPWNARCIPRASTRRPWPATGSLSPTRLPAAVAQPWSTCHRKQQILVIRNRPN